MTRWCLVPWVLTGVLAGCSSPAGSSRPADAATPPGSDAEAPDAAVADAGDEDTTPHDPDVPIGDVDEPDVPDPCGDGVCAADEDNTTCPVDCAGGDSASCLKDACPTEMTACYGSPGCTLVLACLLQCTTQDCAQACAKEGDPDGLALMVEAVQCGQTAGCFEPPDPCGDGVCAPDETPATCPADCAGTCLAKNCGEPMGTCQADPDCDALLSCWTLCGDPECRTGCYQQGTPAAIKAMQDVEACALDNDCISGSAPECGDGTCDPTETAQSCPADCSPPDPCGNGTCNAGETAESCPEDCDNGPGQCGNGDCEAGEQESCPSDCEAPMGSCVGKCGDFTPGASCQCDQQCAGFGDCCPDKAVVCDGAQPECGNDVCEPGESPATCPDDCGAPVGCGSGTCDEDESVESCAADCASSEQLLGLCIAAWCSPEQSACEANASCKTLGACVGACSDQICISECGSKATQAAIDLYTTLAGCVNESGCADGAPFCGDGICGDESCPKDCPDQVVCGDGTCSEGEDESTCPGDCSDLSPEQCVQAGCKAQVSACVAVFECAKALQCAGQCSGDALCAQACEQGLTGSAEDAFGALLGCAVQLGCYTAP